MNARGTTCHNYSSTSIGLTVHLHRLSSRSLHATLHRYPHQLPLVESSKNVFTADRFGGSLDGPRCLQHAAFPFHPARFGRRGGAHSADRCLRRAWFEFRNAASGRTDVDGKFAVRRYLGARAKTASGPAIPNEKFRHLRISIQIRRQKVVIYSYLSDILF